MRDSLNTQEMEAENVQVRIYYHLLPAYQYYQQFKSIRTHVVIVGKKLNIPEPQFPHWMVARIK